jgi:CRP/FNR family transcriptional regulator
MRAEEKLWLKTIPLFANLELADLEAMAEVIHLKQYNKNEILFFQGDPCHGFFCIKTGAVKIYRSTPDGKEVVLHIAGPGESFAEVPVFDGGRYPATAETIKPSTLYFIQKEGFLTLLDRYPHVTRKIIASLARHCRRFVSIIEDLTLKQAHSRLAKHLWKQAEHQTGAEIVVTLGMSKGELAALIGTVPESFSRILRRFQEEGILSVQGRRVIIHDLQKLRDQI